MSEDTALRYSRQISLSQIGEEGQRRLANSSVSIIGLGGLGASASLYVASSGVGNMIINDFDRVDVSNLPRQILFDPDSVGQFKTAVTAKQLKLRNPRVNITELNERLSEDDLINAVNASDAVLDCTDNFAIRTLINRVCVANRTPLISGAAIRMEGQLAVFNYSKNGSGPCYSCLYSEEDENLEDCAGQGILAPVVGTIGCMMATEAVKLLIGLDTELDRKLWAYDALAGSARTVKIQRRKDCPVCSR